MALVMYIIAAAGFVTSVAAIVAFSRAETPAPQKVRTPR